MTDIQLVYIELLLKFIIPLLLFLSFTVITILSIYINRKHPGYLKRIGLQSDVKILFFNLYKPNKSWVWLFSHDQKDDSFITFFKWIERILSILFILGVVLLITLFILVAS